MKTSIRVAALGALLFTASAFADNPDFSKLDADGDKSVSQGRSQSPRGHRSQVRRARLRQEWISK